MHGTVAGRERKEEAKGAGKFPERKEKEEGRRRRKRS